MDRVARAFVCSTFRDMHAEREELVRRVFPALRKHCEDRSVAWSEVDLRWGITDEQRAEGDVLPICLAEIGRCQFFVGLLGERYGWIPDRIPPELVEAQGWLGLQEERSITELEVLHGVLRPRQNLPQAFFYLRDPAYIDSLPESIRGEYLEIPSPREITLWGIERATARASSRREKLNALKARIRASSAKVREGYRNPRELGGMVLEDLTAAIDALYPDLSGPGVLDREAADHEAFSADRARAYIRPAELFKSLERHADSSGPPLTLLGEAGSGKSALLADWAASRRALHPADFTLAHFVEASPSAADWRLMLRRFMREWKKHFGFPQEVPEEPSAVRATFPRWLAMAAAKGRTVLAIDGLDQLEDRDGALDLVWLPREIPANARIVLSTLPGRPSEAAKKRGWPFLNLEPLGSDERVQLVTQYLAHYGKSLSPARLQRIAGAPQTANPLYLRTLLEELRVHGDHQTLDDRIHYYLSAPSTNSLFERVLGRYEADYDTDRPGLVRETMSLLWAARRGLSQPEILDLLGTADLPLPVVIWLPLFLASRHSLLDRSGLLTFSHDSFRQAVRDRYLPTRQEQDSVHLRLADYFHARPAAPPSLEAYVRQGLMGPLEKNRPASRAVEECPWQLMRAHAWERLSLQISDPGFFLATWDADKFDLRRYWAAIETNSSVRLKETYRLVLESLDERNDFSLTAMGFREIVSWLLQDMGHAEEALRVRRSLAEICRRTGQRSYLAVTLGNEALALQALGQPQPALELLREQEAIARDVQDRYVLAGNLGNQANLLHNLGRLDDARSLYRQQEELARELGDSGSMAASLAGQALICRDRGELDRALKLFGEQELLSRSLGDWENVSKSLGNQAVVRRDLGDLEEAMTLVGRHEELCLEMGNKHGLQSALCTRAMILKAWGRLDEAMRLLKQQEDLCLKLGDRAGLANSYHNQANVHYQAGEMEEAMALHRRSEKISRELGDQKGVQASLGDQGNILFKSGELAGAMQLFEQKEAICREVSLPGSLARALNNRALILQRWGDLRTAGELLAEKIQLCSEIGDLAGVASGLSNLGLIQQKLGNAVAALDSAQKAEGIYRQLGNPEGIVTCLVNRALMTATEMHQPHQALPLAEEALRIASGSGIPTLAGRVRPILELVRGRIGEKPAPLGSGEATPPPAQEPWWKRVFPR